MKGYFSQLAHRTGLSFEPGGRSAAGNIATPPPAAALRESRAEVTPLHTEEIAFTAPSLVTPPNVPDRGNEDSAGPPPPVPSIKNESPSLSASLMTTNDANLRPAESRDTNPESTAQTYSWTERPPRTFFEEYGIRFTDSESKTSKPGVHSAEKQSDASEHEVLLFSDEVSRVKSAPPELIERVERFEGQVAAREYEPDLLQNRQARGREADLQENLQPTNPHKQNAPALNEAMEQEVTVQSYLKEVRAWVAASPAIEERELEQNNWSEVPQRRRDVFALEQGTNVAPFPQRDGSQQPEVQDLNLSIGSISVVIEEPKKDAPAPPPAPKADRSPSRTGGQSTILSRYYLRTW